MASYRLLKIVKRMLVDENVFQLLRRTLEGREGHLGAAGRNHDLGPGVEVCAGGNGLMCFIKRKILVLQSPSRYCMLFSLKCFLSS